MAHQMTVMMAAPQNEVVNVYWTGSMEKAERQFFNKWSNYLSSVVPQAYDPRLPYHCTVAYHKRQDVWYGQIWDQEVGQQKIQLATDHAVIGQEGVALAIKVNIFLRKWNEIPGACPHITVLINEGYESKHMALHGKSPSVGIARWENDKNSV